MLHESGSHRRGPHLDTTALEKWGAKPLAEHLDAPAKDAAIDPELACRALERSLLATAHVCEQSNERL